MRRLTPALLLAVACSSTAPAPPAAPMYGFTIEEEAHVLALEDRREFDPAWVASWATHENPLHRRRLAVALARIGPHTFADANGDGDRDSGERQAGVDTLISMAGDPDVTVRTAVAFALGEIGDAAGADALFALAGDGDGRVAGEAIEAISKLSAHVPLARYAPLTRAAAEGPRAMAIRFLFRFDSDEASAIAAESLETSLPPIRQEATYALSRRAYAPARERLELLLASDTNTNVRVYAAAALGRIADPRSLSVLVRGAGDPHPWVRTNSLVALARVAATDASGLVLDDVPRMIAATEDPDTGARAASIDILGYYATKFELARNRLLEIASNGSRWERELAVGAIAKHFAATNPALIPQELTSWQKVRVLEATSAMANGATFRSRYAGDPEILVRMNVVGSIPDDAVDAEMSLIRAALEHDDAIVRATAVERYAASKAESVEQKRAVFEQMERRARNDRENDARLASINGLANLEYAGREPFLRSLVRDNDPVVRRVAADLIVQKLHAGRPQITPLPVRPVDYAAVASWARETHTASIHLTRGVIDIVLLTQDAPMTAWNFAELARRKYFDNSSFMRVVPNFVIQGGDPRNDQSGGPGYAIRDEINLQKYTRAAVGMALSGPDTGGSQFFITHSAQPHLDGGYTVFGRVANGMSGVVDQTERGDRVETIIIDEKAAPAAADVSSIQQTPPPLVTGRMTRDEVVALLPNYATSAAEYEADPSVVDMILAAVQPNDRVEIYMGTWCTDSAREVPKMLKIADALRAAGRELPLQFFALDRTKAAPEELVRGKNIEKVSTFIYYRGDEELGRIVERPVGVFEDDLLALAAK